VNARTPEPAAIARATSSAAPRGPTGPQTAAGVAPVEGRPQSAPCAVLDASESEQDRGRRNTDRTPADTWRACWVCLGVTLLSVCIVAAVVALVLLWGGE
jgi:hypothetical protein